MTFLPIAARELRVASRKRSTFWVRVVAAIVAVAIAGAFMLLAVFSFGMFSAGLGKGLFATLTWLSLAAVLSAGLFFTSDCLSEEKREGTIGFLFLTDLKGFDVVFGKLAATSLRGFYAFIAIFPILAVTLLMGGVTGVQFWKAVLALLNALFLSLAAGLFVSAFSRDSQKALGATLVVMVLLSAAGPLIDWGIEVWRGSPFRAVLSLASPVYVFAISGAWRPLPFWTGLLVNQIVGWTLLGLTCVLLPRAWQEKARSSNTKSNWGYWWRFGGTKRRAVLRRKLLAVNPVLWLACRERWQAVVLWLVCLGTVTAVTAAVSATFVTKVGFAIWMAWSFVGGLVTLVLYVVVASQAGRFFVYAKRSGLLELLLATPLTAAQIVHGQWRALLRMFAVPIVLYLAAQLLASVMAQEGMKEITANIPAPPPMPPAATNVISSNSTIITTSTSAVVVTTTVGPMTMPFLSGDGPGWFVILFISLGAVVVIATNLVALWWFGMWMGLTSKSANMATLKTLLFVQIIPWFAISFGAGMIAPLFLLPSILGPGTPALMMTWFPLISSAFTTLLALAKDIAFIVWSRRRLHGQLRERAADISNYALPPILPAQAAPASETPA